MNSLLKWARRALRSLTQLCDRVEDEPMLVEEAYLDAATIVAEAGDRVAKLGLAELYAKSIQLNGLVDPLKAKAFVAECIQACSAPRTDDDLLKVANAANRLNTSCRTVY